MATKRSLNESPSTSAGAPPAKKSITIPSIVFEPVRLDKMSSQEELDLKVLQFQNRKLAERLEQRKAIEDELRERIERLEKRQLADEAALGLVNRYWTLLDEDLRVMLQRFDHTGNKEKPVTEEEGQTDSKDATTEPPQEGDQMTNEAEAKPQLAAGPIDMEEQPTSSSSRDLSTPSPAPSSEGTGIFLSQLTGSGDDEELEQHLKEKVQFSLDAVAKVVKAFDRVQGEKNKLAQAIQGGEGAPSLEEEVKEENKRLTADNQEVQSLVATLQAKHHATTLKFTDLQDKLGAAEIKIPELKNTIEDLQYDKDKLRQKCEKLGFHLAELVEKMKSGAFHSVTSSGAKELPKGQLEMLKADLDEQRELANNRLAELEKLQQEHQVLLKETEKLKMDLKNLPDNVISETSEYKSLQSQYSVLYNESVQLKQALDEARVLLKTTKNTHLRQIEQMESDELSCQKKLRTEVIQLEDSLAQVRKEYEMLRIEFEQNLAANEQAGPINRELRHLITSLQNHNQQLKGEVARYKRKLREAQTEIQKLKSETPGTSHSGEAQQREAAPPVEQPAVKKEEEVKVKEEEVKKEEPEKEKKGDKKSDSEMIKQLKTDLKKSQENQKEMKLLLDMYKGAPKEQRDKVQLMAAEKKAQAEIEDLRQQKQEMLMAAEKKARAEVEELKQRIKSMEEKERQESKKLADEEALKKLKAAEEKMQELQKSLAATKQEEDALLSEMEVTGQAFEDMQEQNVRLLQQLREKDDANFKLMSERIKSNQIHKLLREEKDVLADQVMTLQTQVDAQNQVVRKLEEKERILQNTLATLEKEVNMRAQAMEMHKRKAVESSQLANDLKFHQDDIQRQATHLEELIKEKSAAVEKEQFKHRRTQEECSSLRRKLDRQKKYDFFENADEVLMEEIKTYKQKLTCPCCNTRKKDAVLTKCFHVFCFECVKTRYDTRQRKCPKCNAAFGVNDFHRLYM
ncbi:PREDICTED: E3 ubiquitin-protein ligase BRE1B-like isoform X6 [Branchiostoma belcheri]|uniref:E3 ubiquitin protein ligase n=1 Tax=Branchiostoma belcheri TaxID=7741 RepID=A0A6P4ZFE9_BRABE|nr:PREDICTED: E3 ubiquitin-protein ligase BRE1B-like isoform X6 [Branchiostoma belcheri]